MCAWFTLTISAAAKRALARRLACSLPLALSGTVPEKKKTLLTRSIGVTTSKYSLREDGKVWRSTQKPDNKRTIDNDPDNKGLSKIKKLVGSQHRVTKPTEKAKKAKPKTPAEHVAKAQVRRANAIQEKEDHDSMIKMKEAHIEGLEAELRIAKAQHPDDLALSRQLGKNITQANKAVVHATKSGENDAKAKTNRDKAIKKKEDHDSMVKMKEAHIEGLEAELRVAKAHLPYDLGFSKHLGKNIKKANKAVGHTLTYLPVEE